MNVEVEEEETQPLFKQMATVVICSDWQLLDNQHVVDQFMNPKHQMNIDSGDRPVQVFCNAGSTFTNKKGNFGSWEVLFNPRSIANMVSSKTMKNKNSVKYKYDDKGGIT